MLCLCLSSVRQPHRHKAMLNKISSLLRQQDKRKHFIIGFVIGVFSLLLAVIIALSKELYDMKFGGCVEKEDVVATILGGLLGRIVSIILLIPMYF